MRISEFQDVRFGCVAGMRLCQACQVNSRAHAALLASAPSKFIVSHSTTSHHPPYVNFLCFILYFEFCTHSICGEYRALYNPKPYLNTVSIVATWLVLALEALFHDA